MRGTHHASALSRRDFLGRSMALLSAAPLLSACSTAADEAGADEINALLITGGTSYPPYWAKMAAEFRARTGITVNYDLLQFTPLLSKEITLSAARSAQYDVYSTHTAQIGAFFPHFEPLNRFFTDADLADFFPVSLAALTNSANGQLAAIPRNMDSRSQYYRTDLYAAHSIQPAKTWDELIDVGRKLTGGDRYGLVLPGSGDPAQRQFADFLWQAGGDWLDADNNVAFNSPAGVEALTFYRDLIKRYEVVPADSVTYQWNENSANFSNEICATVFDWPGAYATYGDPSSAKTAGKFGTAPLASYRTGISCAIAHAMAINRFSAKKEAAAEFIKFTVSPNALVEQYQKFKYYPSRRSIAEQVTNESGGAERKWLEDLRTTIENGKEWPKVPGFDKVSTVVQTAVQSALSDQLSPKAALDAAARESTRILRQEGTVR
ncbi:ABC transporter substrate-binding protein [Saccharopolyspora soli]|uniref:ABC transporter substrate-binding protein n=1 Tax=Saccharopolyspora soli TaxID=2926618 RepID=UPI001F572C0A|nr:sugar ABC transporter substrate-binding protein [Saccharopolyspora soli]